MPMLSKEVLRNKLLLVSMAEKAGAELRPYGAEYRSACPLHGGDNPTGFAIYETGDGYIRWKCFTGNCNERAGGNDEFAFLSALTGKPFRQLMIELSIQYSTEDLSELEFSPQPGLLMRRIRSLEEKVRQQAKRIKELEAWQQQNTWAKYHYAAPKWAKNEWEKVGISTEWQAFWKLGGTETFTYTSAKQQYSSPTMTIPVFDNRGNCLTVEHRLMQPVEPDDKYRPDKIGLGSHCFVAFPEPRDRVIVVEGKKKAMRVALALDGKIQVIGFPGKRSWRKVLPYLTGKEVRVIPDPDAVAVGAQIVSETPDSRLVLFERKIDDMLNAGAISPQNLWSRLSL